MIGVSIMVESFRESLRTYLTQNDPRGSLHHRAGARLRPSGAPHRAGRAARHPRAAADRRAHGEPPRHRRLRARPDPRGRAADGAREPRSPSAHHGATPMRRGTKFERGGGRGLRAARVASCSSTVGDRAEAEHRRVASAPFEVAGVYREYGNDQGTMLMSRAVYQRPVAGRRRCTAIGIVSEGRARILPAAKAARA